MSSQRAALKEVIDALVAGGGKLIDTASVYGNAESVIGDIVRASNVPVLLIFATPSKQPQFRERRSRSARSDLGRAGTYMRRGGMAQVETRSPDGRPRLFLIRPQHSAQFSKKLWTAAFHGSG